MTERHDRDREPPERPPAPPEPSPPPPPREPDEDYGIREAPDADELPGDTGEEY